MPLLRGTEITAVDESVSVHMLAFQYDPLNADISEMFASTREARLRRTKRMVELMAQDFPITWDDVLAQVREGKRTTIAGRISPTHWWLPAYMTHDPTLSPMR